MLKVGLTGGIGCGKSTVSRLFANFGVPIIDADEISHRLVARHQPALQEITQTFGAEMLYPNGELNRAALKTLIFTNSTAKTQLEQILHPRIFQEISHQLHAFTADYCIVSIPLLFETHAEKWVNRILVVDCDAETQLERVKQRDNLTTERIQAIITTQVCAAFRKSHAHDILDNSKNNLTLAEQVKKLHNFYLSLSHF
ncbi:MAG: dephospho-CoA kinase [Methylococcaceae bacterium]